MNITQSDYNSYGLNNTFNGKLLLIADRYTNAN
jgi:hypothetical protein